MKLKVEIEPDINMAEAIFPNVWKCLTDYTVYVDKNGDEGKIEYEKVITF